MTLQSYYNNVDAAKRALAAANRLGVRYHKRRAFQLLNKHRAALRHIQQGTKPAKRYDVDFNSYCGGIPCGVVITDYQAHDFGRMFEPGCDEACEFEVVSRSGYEAPFIANKMTSADQIRIYREAMDFIYKKQQEV